MHSDPAADRLPSALAPCAVLQCVPVTRTCAVPASVPPAHTLFPFSSNTAKENSVWQRRGSGGKHLSAGHNEIWIAPASDCQPGCAVLPVEGCSDWTTSSPLNWE